MLQRNSHFLLCPQDFYLNGSTSAIIFLVDDTSLAFKYDSSSSRVMIDNYSKSHSQSQPSFLFELSLVEDCFPSIIFDDNCIL